MFMTSVTRRQQFFVKVLWKNATDFDRTLYKCIIDEKLKDQMVNRFKIEKLQEKFQQIKNEKIVI